MDWNTNHQKSERYASDAEMVLRKGGSPEQARRLYAKAADAETMALMLVDPDKVRTYGITAVSAASLHFKAEQYGCARLVMKEARRYHWGLPQFTKKQLDELDEMMGMAENGSAK